MAGTPNIRNRTGWGRLRGAHAARASRPRFSTALIAVLLLVGLGLVVYPLVSSYLYDRAAADVVASYDESVSSAGHDEAERQFELARAYNESLEEADVVLTDPFDPSSVEEVAEPYESIMNLAGDGVIGHVEIPKIDVDLPIYHGTSSQVLEEGIGHMANTSFPAGDEGTHAVLTGHTGLPKARLFTDLVELEEGDIFYVHVLDRTFAYRVDQISIVEPSDSSQLRVVEGEDYVTLLTCYPYGVNSHRLLVRGERVPLEEAASDAQTGEAESIWDSQYFRAIALCLAVYVPITILAIVVLRRRRERTRPRGPRRAPGRRARAKRTP